MPAAETHEHRAFLKIYGHGEIVSSHAVEFLDAVTFCYNSLVALEHALAAYERHPRWRYFPDELYAPIQFPMLLEPVAKYVPSGSALILQATTLSSPGFWEFLGRLNPLEQIRLYLNDRHERAKDHDYRNAAEAERLKTEQSLREIETIGAALDIAKRHGAMPEQLAPLLDKLVHTPLERLGRVQDMRIIGHAELRRIEDKRS